MKLGPKVVEHDCEERGCLRNRYIADMLHDPNEEQQRFIDEILERIKRDG